MIDHAVLAAGISHVVRMFPAKETSCARRYETEVKSLMGTFLGAGTVAVTSLSRGEELPLA